MIDSVANLGKMLRSKRPVRARCDLCHATKEFTTEEIEVLAAKLGYRYSLVDRRCKCRLSPGCDGWNRFEYLQGVWWALRTDRGREAEIRRDEAMRKRVSEWADKEYSRDGR